MKIGILTQPLQSNYGGILQNYALQQSLRSEGYDVETIDWWIPNSLHDVLRDIKGHIFAGIQLSKYKAPKYKLTEKESRIIQRNTNRFINKYICRTSQMLSLKDFRQQAIAGGYEAFVVGSDQCWRPSYNVFLPAMFLEFVDDNNVKRVAYAASFGTDEWEFTPEATAKCAALAQKFDLVSVREASGEKLCSDKLGVEAVHVLDPTMLLSKEDYIALIEAEREPQSAGTLFNYILDPDKRKFDFVNRAAHELNLIPFQVLPKCQAENRTKQDVKKRIEDCVFPGVTTWLRAFMDAEMTIVDSFHGMVFSILFNKPFWVIGNAKRGLSRFSSLLKLFKLEDRLLDVSELGKVDFKQPIDWNRVNTLLEQKRIESKNLLFNALR